MASRRGKSQARRNTGSSNGLPGWAWMVIGIVLTIGVIFAAPRFMKSDEGDGFFRPRANPDAQPVASNDAEDADLVSQDSDAAPATASAEAEADEGPNYDFYDLLPGEEVAMTDAQLAAAAREEQARAREARAREQAAEAAGRPQPLPETTAPTTAAAPAPASTSTPPSAPAAAPTVASASDDTPYILQAGSFGASGDAEAVKAKIALLGLNARVESAQINGKTMYRVRMGPYGTASELASAKGKLASGGLPALAIRAK